MTTFVLATANRHKADEMAAVLGALGVTLLPRPLEVPDVDETADTLIGNATLKAHALVAATGQAAIADDTGLFIDALEGRPGVWSARYAGPDARDADNVARVLHELGDVSDSQRTATFRTVIVVAWPDGRVQHASGEIAGTIVASPRGEHGFGYDPIFEPAETPGRTMAELTPDEKNASSHRARALRALVALLASDVTERDDL